VSRERGGLVLERLRAIRGDLADLKTAIVELKERLGILEAQYANLFRRVDRIDERLGLVEAEP
jgi:hypothetical protein